MYEEICYKKNYITESICRLDFVSPIVELRSSMPRAIYDAVKEYYPIAEPQDVIGTEFSVNPMSGPVVNQVSSKQWVFLTRDRNNKCIIDSDKVVFSTCVYNTFEESRCAFLNIMKSIMDSFPSNQGKRLGLRYINSIPLNKNNKWINKKYTSAFTAKKKESTIKLVTTVEYSVSEKDINVRLIFGFNNPDYPAAMKKDVFNIDIDAYSAGIIYRDDLEQYIDDMHYEVQECFESMITDDFRQELNTK